MYFEYGNPIKDKPIRVLHVLQRMEAAGIQNLLMNLYRCIDKTKIQFDFLVHYKEEEIYDEEIIHNGGRIYKFSVREDYNIPKYRRDLNCFFEKHKEYKIIHGHMETLSGIYMKFAKKAQIPTRIAHAHIAGFGPGISPKKMMRELFRLQYSQYATDLFACSKAAGDFLFGNKKYQIIHNAIDVAKFAYNNNIRKEKRVDLHISPDTFVIGNVGRLHYQKNHVFLLKVFKRVLEKNSNSILLIVGDGDERESLIQEAKELEISSKVLFLGNRTDVNSLYSVFDIFVMPSIFEGLPLSGIESQASGCPSIFSNTVSREVKITDLASFLPLNEDVDIWSNAILNSKTNHERTVYANEVKKAGYDIQQLTEFLTNFYMSRAV